MRRTAATLTAFLLASAALAQEAAPAAGTGAADAQGGIVCGEPYVIRRGDTLQRLAVKVYGPDATYHALWAANRQRLGLGDPSLIEIGQTIIAPCPISVTKALQAQAEAAAPVAGADAASIDARPAGRSAEAPTIAAPAPQPSSTETATASRPDPQPALTVVRLPASPLAQAIALRALGETLGAEGFAVADASGDGADDSGLRFPLARPDCPASEAPPEAQAACAALAWSAPLLQQALVWHTRADADPLTTKAALAGLRICRADSAPRIALAAPPDARIEDGGPTRACLAAVAGGRADVAVSAAIAADAALRDPALAAAVAEQPALTTLVTLAAAAPKDDPLARAALAALDLGLARMRASGAWFAQVDAALSLR